MLVALPVYKLNTGRGDTAAVVFLPCACEQRGNINTLSQLTQIQLGECNNKVCFALPVPSPVLVGDYCLWLLGCQPVSLVYLLLKVD